MGEDAHRPVLRVFSTREKAQKGNGPLIEGPMLIEGPLIESPIIIIIKETAEGPFCLFFAGI